MPSGSGGNDAADARSVSEHVAQACSLNILTVQCKKKGKYAVGIERVMRQVWSKDGRSFRYTILDMYYYHHCAVLITSRLLLVASDSTCGADTAARQKPRCAGHEMLPLVSHRAAFRVIP
jgi:hypothetical protein